MTVVKEASRWYVCFFCEIIKDKKDISINRNNAIGVDVGINSYATIAKKSRRK